MSESSGRIVRCHRPYIILPRIVLWPGTAYPLQGFCSGSMPTFSRWGLIVAEFCGLVVHEAAGVIILATGHRGSGASAGLYICAPKTRALARRGLLVAGTLGKSVPRCFDPANGRGGSTRGV